MINSSAQSEASQSANQGNKVHQLGPASPSPPLVSPDVQLPRLSFSQPQGRHRDSESSAFGRPRFSDENSPTGPVIGPQPTGAPSNSGNYLPSPGFNGNHTNLQLASLLDPVGEPQVIRRPHDSPGRMATISRANEEALVSDDSVGYPSPANGILGHQASNSHERQSFSNNHAVRPTDRTSFSTSNGREGSIPELRGVNSLYKAPSADCRYRCLDPVLPYIRDIIPASVACDLLDVYLTEPGSSLFRCASPYILTRLFRRKSLLHPTQPRPTTPALLATMLWCSAQTADIVLLHVPGSRSKICNALYELATTLISDRDPDRWRRIHGMNFVTACVSYVLTYARWSSD